MSLSFGQNLLRMHSCCSLGRYEGLLASKSCGPVQTVTFRVRQYVDPEARGAHRVVRGVHHACPGARRGRRGVDLLAALSRQSVHESVI